MHFTPQMILHRLIATAVMLLELCYIGLWLGFREAEKRMLAFGWFDKGGANAWEAVTVVLVGWLAIVFSQVWGGWLTNPHESLEKVSVAAGWLIMLMPVGVLWLMG